MGRRHRYRDSRNKLDGNLSDITVTRLLAICTQRKVTGLLGIDSWGKTGTIRLRAGTITEVTFGSLRGEPALDELLGLRDGRFKLSQRLPSVAETMPGSDQLVVDLQHTSLPELMQQCESKALSCAISVDRGGEAIELTYRAGELAGDTDVDLAALGPAPARVSALPLNQLHNSLRPAAAPAPLPTTPRRRTAHRSSPPPVPRAPSPQPLAAPTPLPRPQHSLGRVVYPSAASDGWHRNETPSPTAAQGAVATSPVAGDRAWVDPTWVNRNRTIPMDWTHTFPDAGLVTRFPFANAALGVGLICLTLLVGVVASGL